jgi:hypothetical protein
MFCVFHPTNASTSYCSGCNRPLCAACDHRIKAQPYCEDCIVRGVDILRRPSAPIVAPAVAPYPPRVAHNAPSPARATLLALIPGLGAVYNRQNLKALFHFMGTVGLIELGEATHLGLFGFGGFVFFLYSVIDANRTAKAIAAGEDPRDDERRLKWAFARYKPVWGVLLVVSALFVAIASLNILPDEFKSAYVWASLLFVAGAYMIFAYFRSLKQIDEPRSFPVPPRSVVSSTLPGDVAGVTTYTDSRTTSHLGER